MRRAHVATGLTVMNTAELMCWTHPRPGGIDTIIAVLFKEKVSGAKTDRPELAKVIRGLEPDDVLVVTRLDRLARSTRDLLNVLHAVSERGAGFERELIRARTGEGRKRAKARGVRFGRPRKMTLHQRQEAMQRLAAGETRGLQR